MYDVRAQGVDERMINVRYYYHYMRVKLMVTDEQLIQVAILIWLLPVHSVGQNVLRRLVPLVPAFPWGAIDVHGEGFPISVPERRHWTSCSNFDRSCMLSRGELSENKRL